ncbi:MAG: DUF4440 domain-containing protein [Bacteroidia bacterium]|nr:DUF4440 domain-containing protein [Bacteroidia bacterium]
MKSFFLISFLCLSAAVSMAQGLSPKNDAAVRAELQRQQDCWNKGDINCFMTGYWNDPKLLFVGSKGVNEGWDATLKRYQKSYPNKAAMGKLDFEILRLEKLGPKSAFMLGKWHLTREIGDAGGHFTLVWKKIDGKWLIVADHSS